MENTKKYQVTVIEKVGTCNDTLFEKMAKNGDITATKLHELIGEEVKITGYAKCKIETAEKTFEITYYDTEEYGLISSGSEVFENSVKTYFGEVDNVRLTEVKTKQGKTYKAVPVLGKKTEKISEEKTEETTDDLPFNI